MKKVLSYLSILAFLVLTSCANSKVSSSKNNEADNATESHSSSINKNTGVIQGKTDVDFYGNDPNGTWNISVRFNKKIVFNSVKNKISFEADTNHLVVAKDANIVNVFSANKNYKIHVIISTVDCTKSGKTTTVIITDKKSRTEQTFKGCGVYLVSPDLQAVWSVESLNGKTITPKEFPKEGPHFEINLMLRELSGFAGCNQVHGRLAFEYQKMIIKPLISTRMYCGDASDVEAKILKILNGQPKYIFKAGKLILETTDGIIILNKVK